MNSVFKVWGKRHRLLLTNQVEVDLLHINKNCFCSTHKHKHKINKFYVIDGCLEIQTPYGTTLLNKGENFTIEPPLLHRFKSLEKSTVIEIAYVKKGKIKANDIERFQQGGRVIFGKEVSLDEIKKRGLKGK
ncbi:hypothetical protein DRN73_07150 [Candidatus Pacearchaeota archaeon]|nr:MAG: hypothetical protein DRN73_07150 [Candidatus Pacearchaeota archaeon]